MCVCDEKKVKTLMHTAAPTNSSHQKLLHLIGMQIRMTKNSSFFLASYSVSTMICRAHDV